MPLPGFLTLAFAASLLAPDADRDGWSDAEERRAGTSPIDSSKVPLAPRYATVDLGAQASLGWPVALSHRGHRVLASSGATWSWGAGWRMPPPLAEGEQAYYFAIDPDGRVAGEVETRRWPEATADLAIWQDGVRQLVPGTHADLRSGQGWRYRPLRWLREGGLLLEAQPLVTSFDGPVGGDCLVATVAGAPEPDRRILTGQVVGDSSGARWVRDVDGAWLPFGVAPLGPSEVPIALGDGGEVLSRDPEGATVGLPGGERAALPDSATLGSATFTDLPGAPRAVVEVGPPGRVWLPDGKGRYHPPVALRELLPSDEAWTEVSVMAGDGSGALLALGRRAAGPWRILLLLPCRALADLTRATDADGFRTAIVPDRAAHPTEARPLLLWINDDRDEGDVAEEALGDQPGVHGADADHLRPTPRGRLDQADWFPLSLALGRLAEDLPPFEVRLLGEGARLVNVLELDLPVARFNQSLQRDLAAVHGPSRGPFSAAAKAGAVGSGWRLSDGFAERLVGPRLLGHGESSLLLEGRAEGSGPLHVAFLRRGAAAGRDPRPEEILFRLTVPVAVSKVEALHRAADARDRSLRVPPAALGERGEASLPWLIFVHGFNVDAAEGRAWGAEIFRRFHQAGSSAPFVAFRWYGDQGAANYPMAVESAAGAAARLHALMVALARERPGRPFVLVGHSLGAYVCLLAAERAGANRALPPVRATVLVNAAVPSEALDASAPARAADYPLGAGRTLAELMVPPETVWVATEPYVRPECRAAAWASAFPPEDRRSTCRWTGRFAAHGPVINLYSRTEDVLAPPAAPGEPQPGLDTVSDFGAWVYQEQRKGRTVSLAVNLRRAQAGWRAAFGASRARDLRAARPEDRLTLLRSRPAFSDFREPDLLHPDVGPASRGSRAVGRVQGGTFGWGSRELPPGADWTVRDELLAHAIPALSAPAGAVPVAGCLNYRMDGLGPSDTPLAGLTPFPLGWARGVESAPHLPAPAPIWRHSDWRNVAFPYVHPVFALIVRETGLSLPPP